MLAPQQAEQRLGLLIAQEEFDRHREIAGQFEEVLLMQQAVGLRTMPSHQRSHAPAAAPLPTASKPRTFTSERNIVFHVVELAGGLLGGRLGLGGLALGGLGLDALARGLARLARARARAQHLHHVAANLGAVAVLPFLVLPLARAQAALDVDLRALLQVLARDLRQAPEKGDAVPF